MSQAPWTARVVNNGCLEKGNESRTLYMDTMIPLTFDDDAQKNGCNVRHDHNISQTKYVTNGIKQIATTSQTV